MAWSDYINIGVTVLVVLAVAPYLGAYIARVFERPEDSLVEQIIYRFCNVEIREQHAKRYLECLLIFNGIGFLFFFVIVQLPLGALEPMSWHLAFNTAVSFVTNTNWQAYAGEVALTPLMQMLGPTVQNFLSAGTGLGVFLALTRGLRSKQLGSVGNFWRDMTRSLIYILLPLATGFAIVLVSLGVVQSLDENITYQTVEGSSQTLSFGPVASQVAIKQLGSNGGGYFSANSAHPFENPTPLTNFFQVLALLLLPCSLVFTFGNLLDKRRHAWVIFGVMGSVWLLSLALGLWSEYASNPSLAGLNFWEGKEWRFGHAETVLWTTATTATSNGSTNAMIASMSPLTGLSAIFNIMLGEIIFGGVGSGMYGMIIFVLLTVFLSGLMVGRTPEYLQKKIDAYDVKLIIIALIIPNCTILIGSALSIGIDALNRPLGPHGLTELLYAWASAAGNNGSAFAGLNANKIFYNVLLGLAMLVGRFGVIIPSLLLAGSFANKRMLAASAGQLSTDNKMFGLLLFSVIFVLGGLTYFPALLLGPIMEHLLMLKGVLF